MISFDLLLSKLPYSFQRKTLTELTNGYFASPEDFMDALAEEDNEKLETALHETADNAVSVYTSERYEWASCHVQQVAMYEDESSATDAAGRIAYAWYVTELEALQDVINEAREIVTDNANA